MLERIAELEGAAELLTPSREASIVRTKLQEARLAELERLRANGTLERDGVTAAIEDVDRALARGREAQVLRSTA